MSGQICRESCCRPNLKIEWSITQGGFVQYSFFVCFWCLRIPTSASLTFEISCSQIPFILHQCVALRGKGDPFSSKETILRILQVLLTHLPRSHQFMVLLILCYRGHLWTFKTLLWASQEEQVSLQRPEVWSAFTTWHPSNSSTLSTWEVSPNYPNCFLGNLWNLLLRLHPILTLLLANLDIPFLTTPTSVHPWFMTIECFINPP